MRARGSRARREARLAAQRRAQDAGERAPRGPGLEVDEAPGKLAQDLRQFDFMSPWEGAEYVLPGDEKAVEAPPAPPPVDKPKVTEGPKDAGAGEKADKKAAKKVSPKGPAKKKVAEKPAAKKAPVKKAAAKPKGGKAS